MKEPSSCAGGCCYQCLYKTLLEGRKKKEKKHRVDDVFFTKFSIARAAKAKGVGCDEEAPGKEGWQQIFCRTVCTLVCRSVAVVGLSSVPCFVVDRLALANWSFSLVCCTVLGSDRGGRARADLHDAPAAVASSHPHPAAVVAMHHRWFSPRRACRVCHATGVFKRHNKALIGSVRFGDTTHAAAARTRRPRSQPPGGKQRNPPLATCPMGWSATCALVGCAA